ncbi:MAG TPA: glycosyltransferase family 2 protein [Gammaproteobacteria bacterium]|nr:glycosyltransferase family 2 protein [Gammaproteobacteria bacterium]
MHSEFDVVIPARNEAASLGPLLKKLKSLYPQAGVIVVNDGSTDTTAEVCVENGVTLINHPYSMGNGAAIKSGARAAQTATIVFMDADGQHRPEDIQRLLDKLDQGFDMAVGAREDTSQASLGRGIANSLYNRLASIMTGYKIHDLTSGFRAVRTRHFRKFLYLLPNGFSYPTTSTMAFFRSGLPVGYIPILAGQREGKSHIKLLKDGIRFLVIILKIGALFSPMRFFLPISLTLFLLSAGYYTYTYILWERLTNMSAILFLSGLFTFLIGIVSEQISSLHYKNADDDMRRTVRRPPDSHT